MKRLALALLLASPGHAQPVDPLQQGDAAIQTIGWKLARANRAWCARLSPQAGLMLEDVQTFSDPGLARQVFGLDGDVGVGAVASDGPAARAGLAANMTVIQVADLPVASLPPPRPGHWDRVLALQNRLDATVVRTGSARLTLADGRVITIVGEPICQVRFMLDDSHGNAGATRDVVRIGRSLAERLGWQEDLVAALMAHELAHAVLDHQTWLAGPQGRGKTRVSEREADRLAVWLLANAGYDPASAPRMITSIDPPLGFLMIDPDHGGAHERARVMNAEITALRAAGMPADWKTHFRRENGAPRMPGT